LLLSAGFLIVIAAWPSAGRAPLAATPAKEDDGGRDEQKQPPVKPQTSAVAELAERVHLVLKQNCYRCHGENGAAEGGINYILDAEALVTRRKIIPGKAEKSRLFRRVDQGEMPPEGESPRPSPTEIALIKQWIEAGAPPPKTVGKPLPYVTTPVAMNNIHADLMSLPERDRRFARYFTLTHLGNAGLLDDEIQTYRLGLSKLLNSLSWSKEVVTPKAVDAGRTILRIDIRDYQWSEQIWRSMLAVYPYGILSDDAEAQGAFEAVGKQLPFIRADWFVAEASQPPLYHDILQLPATERELEKQLHIELGVNIEQERVVRAGFNGSGVSRNNRLIERHASPYGSYWRSYDFADNLGKRNLFAFPLGPGTGKAAFTADGGEIIFNLPNGLHAFMLVNERGERLNRAPAAIVSDPKRPDRAVVNGISCMSCHARGLIVKKDQVRPHVEKSSGSFSAQELDAVMALYPSEDKLDSLFAKDNEHYRTAIERTGGKLTTTEPINTLVARFEQEVDLPTAAAELGLQIAELAKRLGDAPSLLRSLGPLRLPGGTVQRQVFADAIPELARELQLGKVVTGKQ
jgi:mono/diheme cytochrome c family protein